MQKHKTSFIGWFAQKLHSMGTWLEKKNSLHGLHAEFVDLAPTNKADNNGKYCEAITFALSRVNVSNIALTGPYGSGKSSVIQTFLKTYNRRALHISLATFVNKKSESSDQTVDDSKSVVENVCRQEIERSILQQMLYGADANRLPLSRFQRIQAPDGKAFLTSSYLTIGAAVCYYIFNHIDDVINGSFFKPFELSNVVNLGLFVLSIGFVWSIIHYLYIKSFGVSLKAISLKNIEIKPASDDESSILNRHLDEIIYFFQKTDYDLVIIEDLDRFNNPDIFITLREINNLVNANAGVNNHVRFLYALRDDMFENTDRTKFFEFIIPVIPIINSSNSIDKVLEQVDRLGTENRFDRQFLREVSRYLNDLRLIQNIFNEYIIYSDNLKLASEAVLDTNKLLAVLIYKNVFPNDFENLHKGNGFLFDLLHLKSELVTNGEEKYLEDIKQIEEKIEIADNQTPFDFKELRCIYGMALLEKVGFKVQSITAENGQHFSISSIFESSDAIESLLASSRVQIYMNNNYSYYCNISLPANYNLDTYHKRLNELENKTKEQKAKLQDKIREIRVKLSELRTSKLSEILRLNPEVTQESFDAFGENNELARYLILEGHLDDTYYQYTSLFHKGRMSPNDNKYLIKIRAYITPEPTFPIDNPHEVIAAMRLEDFSQSYVLNTIIIDALMSDKVQYHNQISKMNHYIQDAFENSEGLIVTYYDVGNDVRSFVEELIGAWPQAVPDLLKSKYSSRHIAQLLNYLEIKTLSHLSSEFCDLSGFISSHLPEILSELPELEPERLICMNVEVIDFGAIATYRQIIEAMFKEDLYSITLPNIEFVFSGLLKMDVLPLLQTQNYTTIMNSQCDPLIDKIEKNLSYYLENIIMKLDTNNQESLLTFIDIVNKEELDLALVKRFIEYQEVKLPCLVDAPKNLWTHIVSQVNIVPCWDNCRNYIEYDEYEKDVLLIYMNRIDIYSALSEESLPMGSDYEDIYWFLLGANKLDNVAYSAYLKVLPSGFEKFPTGLDINKLELLIKSKLVVFNSNNVNELDEYHELQVLFTSLNIDDFLSNYNDYNLDDSFFDKLLKTNISWINKCAVIALMDLSTLAGSPDRTILISSILMNADPGEYKLSGDDLKTIILSSSVLDTQIGLLNKYQILMNNRLIRDVLISLPPPYNKITCGGHILILEKSKENIYLLDFLKSKKFISSYSFNVLNTEIKVNLRRKSISVD